MIDLSVELKEGEHYVYVAPNNKIYTCEIIKEYKNSFKIGFNKFPDITDFDSYTNEQVHKENIFKLPQDRELVIDEMQENANIADSRLKDFMKNA